MSASRFIPLDDCVYAYMNRANLPDAHRGRLWSIAFECAEEMNLDVFNSIKTRKLNVGPNMTVRLPQGCKWTKIGVLNSNGEVATLKQNKNMTSYGALDIARLSLDQDANQGASTFLTQFPNFYYNFWYEGGLYNLFGIATGSNSAGEFTVDEENGVILLNNNFPNSYIIVEGIYPPDQSQEVLVPYECKQAIIKYIGWGDIEFLPQSRRKNIGETQSRRREYYNQRRLAKMRISPIQLWIGNDIYRESLLYAVKS